MPKRVKYDINRTFFKDIQQFFFLTKKRTNLLNYNSSLLKGDQQILTHSTTPPMLTNSCQAFATHPYLFNKLWNVHKTNHRLNTAASPILCIA